MSYNWTNQNSYSNNVQKDFEKHNSFKPDQPISYQDWLSPRDSLASQQSSLQKRNYTANKDSNRLVPNGIGPSSNDVRNKSRLNSIIEDEVSISTKDLLNLCNSPIEDIQLNALALLQHKTYKNNEIKLDICLKYDFEILINLLQSNNVRVLINVLNVLRNLSYSNDDSVMNSFVKFRAVSLLAKILEDSRYNANVAQLEHDEQDSKYLDAYYQSEIVLEAALDVIMNLSINSDMIKNIIEFALASLMQYVILPDSGIIKDSNGFYVIASDTDWSMALQNGLGIIKNITSCDNMTIRMKLRNEDGLVDSLVHLLYKIPKDEEENEIRDCVIIQNCVCILSNLTYCLQEIVDKNYLAGGKVKDSNGKKSGKKASNKNEIMLTPTSAGIPKGIELLWDAKLIVRSLNNILEHSTNGVTLEAACGVIQNITAGQWEPSQNVRNEVRVQLLLSTFVELINLDNESVLQSSVNALRNIVLDKKCCNIIGQNSIQIIANKIPLTPPSENVNNYFDILSDLLKLTFIIIKDEVEFMKLFVENEGVQRCIYVRDSLNSELDNNPEHNVKLKKFSNCILNQLWQRDEIRKLIRPRYTLQRGVVVPINSNRAATKSSNIYFSPTEKNNEKLHLRNSVALNSTVKVVPDYGPVKRLSVAQSQQPGFNSSHPQDISEIESVRSNRSILQGRMGHQTESDRKNSTLIPSDQQEYPPEMAIRGNRNTYEFVGNYNVGQNQLNYKDGYATTEPMFTTQPITVSGRRPPSINNRNSVSTIGSANMHEYSVPRKVTSRTTSNQSYLQTNHGPNNFV